jgi:DNA-binding NarL/FixJ family response regulator
MSAAPVRVFLVEDMKHVQGLMRDLLATLGRFVIAGTASTEAEAILWLEEHPEGWDLLVADLILDQGTGLGVVAKCRHRSPGRKVVVLSDYVTPGIHKHCLALGADAAIPKADLNAFIDFCRGLISDGDVRQS